MHHKLGFTNRASLIIRGFLKEHNSRLKGTCDQPNEIKSNDKIPRLGLFLFLRLFLASMGSRHSPFMFFKSAAASLRGHDVIRCLLITVWLVMVIMVVGCSSSSSNRKLIVATAASSQFYAMELSEAFTAKYEIAVDVVVSSSGRITTQLLNGAPFDVFLSADSSYTNILFAQEITAAPPEVFGTGIPVIWAMRKGVAGDSLISLLSDETIRHIAIANPKNAPYGKKALQFLEAGQLAETLSEKLVYGESLAQVNEYVLQQNAEIGFSSKSSMLAGALLNHGTYLELGSDYAVPHSVAIIANEKDDELKKQFLSFMSSEEGVVFLEKYGFTK